MAATDPIHEAKREAFDRACDGIAQGRDGGKRDMGAMKTMSTQAKSTKKSKKLPAGHPHKCTAHKDQAGKFSVWICTDAKCDRFPTKICPDCEAKNPLKMPHAPDSTSNNLGEALGLKSDLPSARAAEADAAPADTSSPAPNKTHSQRVPRKSHRTAKTAAALPNGEIVSPQEVSLEPTTQKSGSFPGTFIGLIRVTTPTGHYVRRVCRKAPTEAEALRFATAACEEYRQNLTVPEPWNRKVYTPAPTLTDAGVEAQLA